MSIADSKVASLVNQMPEADVPGQESKFTGPDPVQAKNIATGILEGGRESILELAGMIRDAAGGGAENYKPGYVLHCIALHVGQPGQEAQRKMFAEAVASKLGGGDTPKEAQAFLARELQVAGGEEVLETLGKLLRDDQLCEIAVQALVAIGGRAAARLREALPAAKGRNRAAIVQALGSLRDAESSAVLREAAGGEERDLRLAAAWALARSGDASGAGAVIRAADRAEGWERIQLTKACLLYAENLFKAGKTSESRRIYNHLRETRKDPSERHVAEAAERGLMD